MTVLNVVGICGSLRKQSATRNALRHALDGAAEVGAQTKLIDLVDYHLVFCDGNESESGYPPDVLRLREQVRAAAGVILATPEYHGGYSGVLKNALDLMGFDEFEGKVMGLIGVAGGRMGATGALTGLRAVGRTLHAWVVPQQVSIGQSHKAFDEAGVPVDAGVLERLQEVGRQVARYAFLHSSTEVWGHLAAWEAGADPRGT